MNSWIWTLSYEVAQAHSWIEWETHFSCPKQMEASYLSLIRKHSWKCHLTMASRWSLPHHTHTVLGVCEAGAPWPGRESFGAATTLCLHIFMWGLLLCNDCDQNKAEKQTVPGEELDHSSCLPATKTDKDSQWSTSTSFSLKCNCKSTQFNATMFNVQSSVLIV